MANTPTSTENDSLVSNIKIFMDVICASRLFKLLSHNCLQITSKSVTTISSDDATKAPENRAEAPEDSKTTETPPVSINSYQYLNRPTHIYWPLSSHCFVILLHINQYCQCSWRDYQKDHGSSPCEFRMLSLSYTCDTQHLLINPGQFFGCL